MSAKKTAWHPPFTGMLLELDLGAVAESEGDDLLRVFAGRPPRTLATRRWFRQNRRARSATMDAHPTPDLEGYDELLAEMLNDFTPEERLVGLTPAQRLAGLAPQERLAGLAPEEALLALPDAVLPGF